MTDQNITGDLPQQTWDQAVAAESGLDGDWTPEPTFKPDYELDTKRIYRKRLHQNDGGVAEVTFRGDIADATQCWIRGGRGDYVHAAVPSVYAEVEPRDDLETTLRIALVPTGKRVPLAHDGGRALRLGAGNRLHAYLLSVESHAPRADVADMAVAEAAATAAQAVLRDLPADSVEAQNAAQSAALQQNAAVDAEVNRLRSE